MPADDLYWNPMDLDSDESIPYPKQYIDPWDLENYAYIRQHLDSVDLNSDPSSLGEPQETSAFYYIPAKPAELPIEQQVYGSKPEKIYGSKNEDYYYLPPPNYAAPSYAAIEELPPQIESKAPKRRRQYERSEEYQAEFEDIYEPNSGRHSHIYETNRAPASRQISAPIYIKNKSSRNRSQSFSVGEYDYDVYRPMPINGPEYVKPDYFDGSPIYDDIRTHRTKPKNFKLGNYGHLQIDYSCSWNNLNKYIYN